MTKNALDYAEPPRKKGFIFGALSIISALLWMIALGIAALRSGDHGIEGLAINIFALLGFAFGVTAVIVSRAKSLVGWIGLLLNSLPIIGAIAFLLR